MADPGPLRTLELTIAYDGTEYVGWQRQANGVSIQQLVEEALERLEGAPVTTVGAGRTDAGVHALGQVVSTRVTFAHDPTTIVRALNATLPGDVRVLAVGDADARFHARFQARTKTYRYLIRTGSVVGPFERRFVWHVPGTLDAGAMHAAAGAVVGEHDFQAFRSAGTDVEHSVRVVLTSTVRVVDAAGARDGRASIPPLWDPIAAVADVGPVGPLLAYEVTGTGFLRHMVRTLAGTLVEIGLGRRPVAWMGEVLAGRDRALAGQTAPAQGLFLVAVDYGPAPDGQAAATLAGCR